MQRLRLTLFLLTIFILSTGGLFSNFAVASSEPTTPEEIDSTAIISEIKLGGDGLTTTEPREYLTIFNRSEAEVDLDGWRVGYAKQGFDNVNCEAQDWGSYANGTEIELAGNLPALSVTSIEISLTDSKDGSLRLTESTTTETIVHDLVGWGESAPCYETTPNKRPSTSATPAESLQRYVDCELGYPVDSNDNLSDLTLTKQLAYGQLSTIAHPDCAEDPSGSDLSCEGVVITEVLPNPEGSDAGQEFIELHNPANEVIPMGECSLQVASSSKIYNFSPEELLQPGQYQAFYNDDTALTLPNSSGGTVYLLNVDSVEIDAVSYPPNLEDDQSWSKFSDDTWASTYTPTPHKANILLALKPCPIGQTRSEESGRCKSDSVELGLVACKAGQARNPATNRCRTITAASSTLKPCAPHQERNSATNRCRSISASVSSLVPCKPDQERNPATNRCRKIGSGTATLKPCAPDQERNPATNRCRKKPGVGGDGGASVLGSSASIPSSPLTGGLVATTAALALVYGAYEFRGDIRNRIELLRRYFSRRTHAGP